MIEKYLNLPESYVNHYIFELTIKIHQKSLKKVEI
jgi:hypothetical protein